MSIVVYWLEEVLDIVGPVSIPQHKFFADAGLVDALAFCKNLRDAGCSHVTISTENPNSVGKPGVDSVENGKTPDGVDYTWTKRRTPSEQRK